MTATHYRFDFAQLKPRRLALGLSREQVAVATGRSKESITSYELGRSVPNTETVLALCPVLECQPEDLLVPVDEDVSVVAEDLRKRSRRRQGLPDRVADESVLDAAAELLRPTGSTGR
jgi:transcriptional regulator with XRE-family HTH domain